MDTSYADAVLTFQSAVEDACEEAAAKGMTDREIATELRLLAKLREADAS